MSVCTPPTDTLKPYRDAIAIQDASNLSGIVRAFHEATQQLWNEARANGMGTDYVNRHPVVTLFLSQLCQVHGRHRVDGNYFNAWHACRDVAETSDQSYESAYAKAVAYAKQQVTEGVRDDNA